MKNIVILTGSGISAESGISTFRGGDGLWDGHRIEDVATPEAFERDPDLVQSFYNTRRAQLATVKPNPAHAALVALENAWQGEFLLVTQNVDDLHERAGSKKLIHMHGELKKARCLETGQVYDWQGALTQDTVCACCQREGMLRPHIVWFGEMPLAMEHIYHALRKADIFLSIGTSGLVYPAAGFVQEVRRNNRNCRTVEINLEPTAGRSYFAESVYGKAGEVLPGFVQQLLND
ncbi:MAG: NAD-dependent protein deacylase [Proteobacteria bacterium]|nr:NAD-dependent protein deacylase [Pseudomonadota bacterium]